MKALIVIGSYIGTDPGYTQAMRDAVRETYLKGIGQFPELEYRFFMGDGTPTGDNEDFILNTLSASYTDPGYKDKALRFTDRKVELTTYSPKSDEVLLHVPDDYPHITYKLRAEQRWAVEHGFDFVFQSSADIYIDLKKLLNSGFQNYDYSGRAIDSRGLYPNVQQYAGGHAGYWFSRIAAQFVANSPVDFWCDDIWAGQRMFLNNVPLHSDLRYANSPDPKSDNDTITAHLGDRNGIFGVYDPKIMRETHAANRHIEQQGRWLRRAK